MSAYLAVLAIRQSGLGDKPPHDVDYLGNINDGRGSRLQAVTWFYREFSPPIMSESLGHKLG